MRIADAEEYLIQGHGVNDDEPTDILVRALSGYVQMSDEEVHALEELSRGKTRSYRARRDIMREGEPPQAAYLIRSGWLCRYKALADGRRQIIAILLPGDIFDLNQDLIGELDHSIATITPAQLTELNPQRVREIISQHPRLIEAFYWREMVHNSILREWVLNVGQRRGLQRIAHLICELYWRLEKLGLASENSIRFPVTQGDLADATGLTPVHVNRMMKQLRDLGMIRLRSRKLALPDLYALQGEAAFNDNYLHLGHKPVQANVFNWA